MVDETIMKHFNVSHVCHGLVTESSLTGIDPYEIPKTMGIFKNIDSKCSLTTDCIIDRIVANRSKFSKRNAEKQAKEAAVFKAWEEKRQRDGINAVDDVEK